jgi:hypothetical protein
MFETKKLLPRNNDGTFQKFKEKGGESFAA